MWATWSVKGGVGTTVVAAALAHLLAEGGDVLAIDLAGDLGAALGVADPAEYGLAGWLEAAPDVPATALSRLEVQLQPGLSRLSACGELDPTGRWDELATHLNRDSRAIVIDAGNVQRDRASSAICELLAHVTTSLLVLRPCYLALHRSANCPMATPTGVVLIDEPGRTMSTADVADVVGAPVVANIDLEPAVARAVDAGIMAKRIPRRLGRSLRGLL